MFSLYQSMAQTRALIGRMVAEYRAKTPSYARIVDILGSAVQSDHIALRSFRSTGGYRNTRETLLEGGAYVARDCFRFPQKHVQAQWFGPTTPGEPRVFLSEILDSNLSTEAQSIIARYLPIASMPTYDEYVQLERESNYAAWTLVHGTVVNHETIPVHNMGVLLEDFVKDMKEKGVKFVETPSAIKVSDDGLLRQASSPADLVEVKFRNGTFAVPGSFVEYIHRGVLPQFASMREVDDNHRRDGFAEGNAFHIFDSTKHV